MKRAIFVILTALGLYGFVREPAIRIGVVGSFVNWLVAPFVLWLNLILSIGAGAVNLFRDAKTLIAR